MEQDQDIKKKKIRRFQEVELRESEFRKACELDSDEFKNIRNEYFKRTFVNHLIWIIIWAAVFALWPAGVIYKVYDRSEAVGGVLILLVAIGAAMCTFLAVRCIFSLVIISKINKQDFYWHEGHITRRKRLWTLPYLRMDFYYLVDDEYCSRTIFDPFYFKGTEVYSVFS